MTAIYSENVQVLRELTGLTHFGTAPTDAKLSRVMVVDTEATGLDRKHNEIIELAFNLIEFDPNGNFYKILFSYSAKQEPQFEISPEAERITGYTKEDLIGEKIDWDLVNKVLEVTDVVVAFNSYFDRPLLERHHEGFRNKFWACAMSEIGFIDLYGYAGSQELLMQKVCNVYYGAHNAMNDVNALALLLNQVPPNSDKTLFYHLMKKAAQKQHRVWATGAEFSDKDKLKDNQYKFNFEQKVWFKDTPNKEEEIEFLDQLGIEPTIVDINGFNKFRLEE